MIYDPFARGPHPVGVVTFESEDAARGRTLPLELWYPAAEAHRGQDLDPATQAGYRPMPAVAPLPQAAVRDAAPAPGRHPVVAFSHGFAGHRCQSTFLCTHLASHGYVVVAPDHVGNTTMDVMMEAMKIFQGNAGAPDPAEMMGRVHEIADLRPADLSHALDRVLGGDVPAVGDVDAGRVAVAGHSFGGWTALMVAGHDPRVGASVPLAPAGGSTDLPVNPFADRLALDGAREVPTLYVVADRDSLLPLRGMHELLAKTRGPRAMVVLRDTDHQHFCDNAEQIHELFRAMQIPGPWGELDLAARMAPFAELMPAADAGLAIRGLTLAHLDAHLGGPEGAAGLLADAVAALAARGVGAAVAPAMGRLGGGAPVVRGDEPLEGHRVDPAADADAGLGVGHREVGPLLALAHDGRHVEHAAVGEAVGRHRVGLHGADLELAVAEVVDEGPVAHRLGHDLARERAARDRAAGVVAEEGEARGDAEGEDPPATGAGEGASSGGGRGDAHRARRVGSRVHRARGTISSMT